MADNKIFSKFKSQLLELAHIKTSLALLNWDLETKMPPKGLPRRAQTTAYLAGLLHKKFLSGPFEKSLNKVKELAEKGELNEQESVIVREVTREFEIERKLPASFVKKFAELTTQSHQVWAEARKNSDFKKFKPMLSKIVELCRKEAELIGFKDSPYDALLDLYEPRMTAAETSIVLEDVKSFLVPFIAQIKQSAIKTDETKLLGLFPAEKQKEFNRYVIKTLGFDFDSGRMDVSTHPFAMSFHPQDTRITTRYNETNLLQSLFGAIHETGHALYDQGLLPENFGTPMGENISLGIHESQSRLWENLVGRSQPFWKFFYPKLQGQFPEPFSKIEFEQFYQLINSVNPSLIRVEADEVTYNLHIIQRFEIEKELIEGTLEVADLPQIWNERTKQYFGLDVPNDSEGVLQDVHWSWGSFGYFPTYTLGNLYSAQFFNAAKRDIMNLDEQIVSGQFGILREWLRKNIHIHGKRYTASELVKKVTGEELTSKYFVDYIKDKYGKIYKL
ncbi:MAG TPA: carboxypeptidase M32 [Patescibacteria group bacterium]|jgi:carboxypeptidase Taq|nr:carboxypeptidase M32 [Patescibacteria group bacterium]